MESPPGELRHRGPVPRIAPSGERATAAPLELKELNKLAMRSRSGSAPPSVSFIVKVILWPACGRGEPPQQQGKSDGDNDGNDNVDHHAWLLNCPPAVTGVCPSSPDTRAKRTPLPAKVADEPAGVLAR